MAKKADEEKFGSRLLLSLNDSLHEQLRDVAKEIDFSVQEMLREAARAIVRAYKAHGTVPRDMELRQLRIDFEAHALAAEDAGEYGQSGKKKATTPRPSQRSPGSGTPLSRSEPHTPPGHASASA